jgi:hypothetical protein
VDNNPIGAERLRSCMAGSATAHGRWTTWEASHGPSPSQRRAGMWSAPIASRHRPVSCMLYGRTRRKPMANGWMGATRHRTYLRGIQLIINTLPERSLVPPYAPLELELTRTYSSLHPFASHLHHTTTSSNGAPASHITFSHRISLTQRPVATAHLQAISHSRISSPSHNDQ